MSDNFEVPAFASEAEEAEWWFANRDRTAEWMEQALAERSATKLSEILEKRRLRNA
jgi:hypothetical protein